MDAEMRKLNEEGRQLWDRKADFWDALHGEQGNLFHRQLIGPAVERLLGSVKRQRVIDVACGSGVMARRLAELGGRVTAVDFSAALIELAQERGQRGGPAIQYEVIDAIDEEALVSLGESKYDAAVCTMAFMDIPILQPLYRAVRRLLHDTGRFVFATAHPAFSSNHPIFVDELEDQNGKLVVKHGLRIDAYLEVAPRKGVGAPDEPAPHFYFHRPLHQLFGEAFAEGFVLEALEEPAFQPSPDDVQTSLSWRNLWQIPPVLAGRMRVAK